MLPANIPRWAVAAAIGFFVIVLIILLKSGGHQKHDTGPIDCKLRKEEPDLDFSVKNVASSDNTSLANFKGYFVYEGSSQSDRYRSLQLNSLTWVDTTSRQQLFFDLTCATLIIKNVYASDGTCDTIAVMNVPDLRIDFAEVHCELELFESFEFDGDDRYVCHRRRSYPCTQYLADSKSRIGQLIVTDLEYEAHGDPKMIRHGKFSKSAIEC